MAAVGALGAALPEAAADLIDAELRPALQTAFLLYAVLGGLALLLYRNPPRDVRTAHPDRAPAKLLGRSRRIVLTLAALFSLDAFAGGLVVQSLLALWVFERFGLSLATAGAIFFWTGALSPCPTSPPPGLPIGSGSSTPWCAPTFRPTYASRSCRSP